MTQLNNQEKNVFVRTNQDAMVLALMENARLAGATQVQVHHDSDTGTLIVCVESSNRDLAEPLKVLKDFRSAVFTEARIVCGDTEIQFSAKSLTSLELSAARERGLVPLEGMSVSLNGFHWPAARENFEAMVQGFSIPVSFNGEAVHH